MKGEPATRLPLLFSDEFSGVARLSALSAVFRLRADLPGAAAGGIRSADRGYTPALALDSLTAGCVAHGFALSGLQLGRQVERGRC